MYVEFKIGMNTETELSIYHFEYMKRLGSVHLPILPCSYDFVCLLGFYGISTFVGYLMPNPFLYK